jgi:hypothetical protein
MEKAQNLVATHAKSNHIVGSSISPSGRKEHSDPRFYTWSAKLVNSIRPLKVKVFVNGLEGDVVAGEKYATKVEIGGPNSRAFPFLGPALIETAPQAVLILAAAVRKVIK